MKLTQWIVWALLAQVGLLPAVASADMIVDTGASPNTKAADPGATIGGSPFPGTLQFVAGEFTTTRAYDITSLSAFVEQYGNCSGCAPLESTFELGLATGPANPSFSAFTQLISEPVFLTLFAGTAGWATTSVPDYLLPAGTYWIVASAKSTDLTIGLGMPEGVPNPLDAYAYTVNTPNSWQVLQPTLGFQIEGNPVSPVPLPGGLGLLTSGLAALATLRRSRIRAK
jgi:hypothetical protein